jgi:hypothetical protein
VTVQPDFAIRPDCLSFYIAIDNFYKPPSWKVAPLRPGKSLELGLYHGSDALAFVVNDGEVSCDACERAQ